jgi:hypothetical protein
LKKANYKRAGRAATAIAVGAAGVLALAEPAVATPHSTDNWWGNHQVMAEGHEDEYGTSQEYWWGFKTGEVPYPMPPWQTVCNYQGQFITEHPDGSWAETNTSSFHSGCSWSGWFDFHSMNDRWYAENKRFKGKWTSNQTGGWSLIGVLVE